MRLATAVIAALAIASAPAPVRGDVQSFFLHFADPPIAVPGGPTSHFVDALAPTSEDPFVFEQTTPKGETTTFPTFTSTPFAAGTTLNPIASVRIYLAANQKMRSCAAAGATVFSVAPDGTPTAIGSGMRSAATVGQGSAGGVVGAGILRIEFPLADTTLAAGESFAVASSLTNDCSINRRTFFAYDGDDDASGVRFQCCLTTVAKCAAKKMRATASAVHGYFMNIVWDSTFGHPFYSEDFVELQRHRLARTFAKLDAKGCPTTNDSAAISALIESFAAAMDTALDPLGPGRRNRCQTKKIKAVDTRAKKGLDLEARAATRAEFLDVDPERLAKVRAQLAAVFAKHEAKGGCDTTGDLAAIEAAVHAFVTTVSARLACPCP